MYKRYGLTGLFYKKQNTHPPSRNPHKSSKIALYGVTRDAIKHTKWSIELCVNKLLELIKQCK